MITDIARRELKSYRQLPVNFYQIQTKFRDEIRPRFGVMRAREFTDEGRLLLPRRRGLARSRATRRCTTAYTRIFTRMGLDFRAVQADTGSIGGNASQEFHVLADSGEDAIAFSDGDDYAANVEMAEALAAGRRRAPRPTQTLQRGGHARRAHHRRRRGVPAGRAPRRCLKTLLVEGSDGGVVALVVRGDHELNAVKAQKLPGVASPLQHGDAPSRCAPPPAASRASSARSACKLPACYADRAARAARRLRLRRQRDGHAPDRRQLGPRPAGARGRSTCATWWPATRARRARARSASRRGIEVGHIFQLGRKYSEAMKATVLDEQGQAVTMIMGCYGIGVTRVVAAAIEQNHDERGIIWPEPIAPFHVSLIPINLQKSERVREIGRAPVRASCRRPASRCCSTTATRARASSSPTPSCSASRTASWSATRASSAAASSTSAGRRQRRRGAGRAAVVQFLRERSGAGR